MDVETVECPVCDHKIPADATRCPNCKAVFSLSDIEELKKVAKEISDPVTANRPSVDEPTLPHDGEGTGRKPGLMGKLFGRKK